MNDRRRLGIAEEAQRHSLVAAGAGGIDGRRRGRGGWLALFDLTRVARRGPRHEDAAEREDKDESSPFVHGSDKCKLKRCRFKPCSSTRAACSSTPTGRASATRWRRHGVDVSSARLAAAEPRAKKRLDTGDTIQATNDQQRGWTYFNLVLTEAGVPLSDATAAALAELHVYHQTHNLWETVPDEVLPSLAALRAAGLAPGRAVQRERHAAPRLRPARADARRST